MAQLSYAYQAPRGAPGSLLDISPYRIDSRANGEKQTGKLKYGMGAVRGSSPGSNVALPYSGVDASHFEGVVMTGLTTEMDIDGEVALREFATVGVLRYGSAWVRIVDGIDPEYGDPLYLVDSGSDAGLFTNDPSGGIAVNGRFGRERGTGLVHSVDIYDQGA